jgi:hypothetical protein
MFSLDFTDLAEPTAHDLAAIDDEWPMIDADLAVLDAQIAMIYAEDRGGPTALDWRRLRRAEARVTRVAADLAARPRSRRAA